VFVVLEYNKLSVFFEETRQDILSPSGLILFQANERAQEIEEEAVAKIGEFYSFCHCYCL